MENQTIAYIILANVIALNFKIVWEFIKERKNGNNNNHTCLFHNTHNSQIKKLEVCVNAMKREDAKFHATVETELKNIATQLNDGKEHFKTLSKSINHLKIAFAKCRPNKVVADNG